MNNQKTLITFVFLVLVGATTGMILHARVNQRLGVSGVLTKPLPGTKNLQVILPDHLPDYTAEPTNQPDVVTRSLPDDTSFGRCFYLAPGFQTCANVVLMGTDRSSIHKPEVCLTGQGWKIDDANTKVETIRMEEPVPYDLSVMHMTATLNVDDHGQPLVYRGIYVYWYVDGDNFTASNMQMMWWMSRDVLLTGVLDRFAYIAYFSSCAPGHEDETFEKMKKVIVETVPKFQLVPKPGIQAGKS